MRTSEVPETVEPGVIHLNSIEAALVDQLVERRQQRTGGSAAAARRGVIEDMKRLGLREAQREEGLAP